MSEDTDKRIAKIDEFLKDGDWDRLHELGFSEPEEFAEWLIDQLKEDREELKTALDTANRSSKAVLKWNAEIEQRTKDDCKQIIKDKWWPHDYGYKLESILQAIEGVSL